MRVLADSFQKSIHFKMAIVKFQNEILFIILAYKIKFISLIICFFRESFQCLLVCQLYFLYFISVQFSHSVMSDSLRPHESQHARPPCPSPTPGVHSDSHPSSQWCHPAISSSVVPFSSCTQSLPASTPPGATGWENRETLVKRYKLLTIEWMRPEDLEYSMVSIFVNMYYTTEIC